VHCELGINEEEEESPFSNPRHCHTLILGMPLDLSLGDSTLSIYLMCRYVTDSWDNIQEEKQRGRMKAYCMIIILL
jgi:hypothetical protein